MVYGIGVDIARIGRVKHVIEKWGDKFLKRVFTSLEIEACSKRPNSGSAFTLRFAAKEAFSKAMGLGMRKGIKWRDIEIFNYSSGRPGLRLYGTARDLCFRKGVSNIHISLSDEGDYGIAMVVLEKEG